MFQICEICPDENKVRTILENLLFPSASESEENDEDESNMNPDEVIKYKEWVGTDRSELTPKFCDKEEYLDLMQSKLSKLLTHTYVAKEQSCYLKEKVTNLESEEAVSLVDFSENYKYVIQDSVQSFYWGQKAVTVHPVVVYLNIDGKVQNINFCFFTEDLKHDITLVKIIQNKIVDLLKDQYPQVKHVEFFSDGCVGQYKNAENFSNLLQYKEKYGISVVWNFFATAHGKSPCDGIGGTVKRTLARESLKRPYNNQITNIEEILKCCREYLPNIKCFSISAEEIELHRKNLTKEAKTIPGT